LAGGRVSRTGGTAVSSGRRGARRHAIGSSTRRTSTPRSTTKSEDIGARLSEVCPNGIGVFFDNVGGAILNEVLVRISVRTRIVLCGSISKSKSDPSDPSPANYFNLVTRRARMEGFTGLD
jgi:NADPH:quinone reductase-like Zn-dependent oxidoreductase